MGKGDKVCFPIPHPHSLLPFPFLLHFDFFASRRFKGAQLAGCPSHNRTIFLLARIS
jgi:hypothetical protein